MSTTIIDLDRGLSRASLARAIAWAEARYRRCDVCQARCGVDRFAGELGVCGLGAGGRVYKEYLHYGEEACLIPSHTVFLTGCNFRCVFCSDDDQVRNPSQLGVVVPPEALAARIAQRRREGATNVNFVGGLPDVNVLYILNVLRHCPDDTHVVWNTNLWTTDEAIAHLDGVVGTWLVDLKFGPGRCARKLARIEDYWPTMTRLLPIVAASDASVLIRHLLMPGHLDCCTIPALDWLAANLAHVGINLMTGYQPRRMAQSASPMSRALPVTELERALAYFDGLKLRAPLVDGLPIDRRRQG